MSWASICPASILFPDMDTGSPSPIWKPCLQLLARSEVTRVHSRRHPQAQCPGRARSPPTLSRCTRSFSSSSSCRAARIASCSRRFSCAQTPELPASGAKLPRPPRARELQARAAGSRVSERTSGLGRGGELTQQRTGRGQEAWSRPGRGLEAGILGVVSPGGWDEGVVSQGGVICGRGRTRDQKGCARGSGWAWPDRYWEEPEPRMLWTRSAPNLVYGLSAREGRAGNWGQRRNPELLRDWTIKAVRN